MLPPSQREQHGLALSLADFVRAIAVGLEGHYIAAPLQEALLTLLVGPAAVATLARLSASSPSMPEACLYNPALPSLRMQASNVAWPRCDEISLHNEMRSRVFMLQTVARPDLQAGLNIAADQASPDHKIRGRNLFVLAPRMLLYRNQGLLAPHQTSFTAASRSSCCGKHDQYLFATTPSPRERGATNTKAYTRALRMTRRRRGLRVLLPSSTSVSYLRPGVR